MAVSENVALIMAGGSGTRFWPLSRPERPKQSLKLLGERSLIQQTVDRLVPLVPPKNIFVCSASQQEALLRRQLPEVSGWIVEPQAKNTAPCLMLSVWELLRRGYPESTAMIVLPADHHIGEPAALRSALKLAVETAQAQDALVTLGIVPECPHTGYGYIEAATSEGSVRAVRRFVEKPDRDTAAGFLKSPLFFWNAGIFVWTLKSIRQAFERYLPEAWAQFTESPNGPLGPIYARLPALPIDIAVLEKASNVMVIPAKMGWSDVGSWGALHELQKQDAQGNCTLSGDSAFFDSSRCLVRAPEGRKVALVGVHDLIVVEEGDTLLVVSRSHDQKVRQAAEHFEKTSPASNK